MNNQSEINMDMIYWIIEHRPHRKHYNPNNLYSVDDYQNHNVIVESINQEQIMTLNELYSSFNYQFPNVKDSNLEIGSFIDEQLCGIDNCGNYWRHEYGFPGEVGTVTFCNFLDSYIRVTSTGMLTFNFEIIGTNN